VTMQTIHDLRTPIGEILDRAGTSGLLVQAQGKVPFALIPLDDDVLDLLIERNPKFIEECGQIRQRMQQGGSHTQDEIKAMFGRA